MTDLATQSPSRRSRPPEDTVADLVETADLRRRYRTSKMTEPLDAELVKDLRAWASRLRSMETMQNIKTFVQFPNPHEPRQQSISTVVDRCEVERNPISLAAVQALGDAHCSAAFRCITRWL